MRKFYLLLLFLPFLLPVSSMAQNQIPDTVYVFRFVSHKDMFYVPWKDNETQLDHLLAVVETHKATILSGEVPLLIDGYCASEPTSVENLKLARVSSNRVKSELILEKGLNESCFITHNHTAPYGDLRHVVIVRLRFPQEEVEEKPIVEEKETFIIAPEKPKQETPADSTSPTDTSSEMTETPLKASDFHHLTLRANLLHWATLTPDLGFEWRMNRHFGLLLNGSWTTWSWDHKNRRYALWKVSPEVRYYLGKQRGRYHTADRCAGRNFGSRERENDGADEVYRKAVAVPQPAGDGKDTARGIFCREGSRSVCRSGRTNCSRDGSPISAGNPAHLPGRAVQQRNVGTDAPV